MGVTARQLIAYALDVPEFEVVDLPEWARSDWYDIEAVPSDSMRLSEGAAKPESATPTPVQREMLLSLLKERFGFRYKRVTRQAKVYDLIKVAESKVLQPTLHPDVDPRGGIGITAEGVPNGDAIGLNLTMAGFAKAVGRQLEVTVRDKTGLTGAFDFRIHAAEPNTGDAVDGVLMALKPLGLGLRATTGPADRIAVEAIHVPDAN